MHALCELCGREPSDRFIAHEHTTLEIVDCEQCGVFAIGYAMSTLVSVLWSDAQKAEERARVQQSNRAGYVHHVGAADALVDGWGLTPAPNRLV
ncbi:MAG TPA: hypothetical protein VHB25_08635 [Gemmatimonadaceae bacterium]|nr:hypothetical protein [Gemmatimonadaceae bacterium]